MKGKALVLSVLAMFLALSVSYGAGQSSEQNTIPAKVAGPAPKIMGVDEVPYEPDLAGISSGDAVQYPTNTSLSYRGVVMANVNTGNDATNICEIICDFGTSGVWVLEGYAGGYDGNWHQISGANPDGILAALFVDTSDWEIVGDFGSLGLWKWNYNGYPGDWVQISGANADSAFATDDDNDGQQELHVDFGSLGTWRYDDVAPGVGTWTQFSTLNPDRGLKMDTYLLGYQEGAHLFPGAGVWRLWWQAGAPVLQQLTGTSTSGDDNVSAVLMGGTAEDLVIDFGDLGAWLLKYDTMTEWHNIIAESPAWLQAVNFAGDSNYELLYVPNYTKGLYLWDYSGFPGTLTKIHDSTPGNDGKVEPFDPDGNTEAQVDEEVAVDFGTLGLWMYDSTTAGWTQLSGSNPVLMVRGDYWTDGYNTALVVGFGATGLWVYDGRFKHWWQISGLNPDSNLGY